MDSNLTAPSPSFGLLKSPWADTFLRLLSHVEENLMLVSPFIKRSKTEQILSQLQKRGIHNRVRVVVLTDLRPESTLNGLTDLEALVQLGDNLPRFDLTYLPSLHAKVYVAERERQHIQFLPTQSYSCLRRAHAVQLSSIR